MDRRHHDSGDEHSHQSHGLHGSTYELPDARGLAAWHVAEPRGQISDQDLRIAPFSEVPSTALEVGESFAGSTEILRRLIPIAEKVKNEGEKKATLAKAFDVGRDGVAEVQELDAFVQIPSKRIIESRYFEIGDENSGFGLSQGEEIDGLGEPRQADRRWSQRFQAAKQSVIEGA